MAIENRILDALVQYQEDEKILSKNKEKLMNACTGMWCILDYVESYIL